MDYNLAIVILLSFHLTSLGNFVFGKHVHLKIIVPKFIDDEKHTKTIYVHVGGGHTYDIGHGGGGGGGGDHGHHHSSHHEEEHHHAHHHFGTFGHGHGHGGGGHGGGHHHHYWTPHPTHETHKPHTGSGHGHMSHGHGHGGGHGHMSHGHGHGGGHGHMSHGHGHGGGHGHMSHGHGHGGGHGHMSHGHGHGHGLKPVTSGHKEGGHFHHAKHVTNLKEFLKDHAHSEGGHHNDHEALSGFKSHYGDADSHSGDFGGHSEDVGLKLSPSLGDYGDKNYLGGPTSYGTGFEHNELEAYEHDADADDDDEHQDEESKDVARGSYAVKEAITDDFNHPPPPPPPPSAPLTSSIKHLGGFGNSQKDVFDSGHNFDNFNSAKGDFGKHSFGNEFLDHWHDVYDKKYATHGSYSNDAKH